MRVLDPETATLEEVALADRNLERAKHPVCLPAVSSPGRS
jgi:hypothetical protein